MAATPGKADLVAPTITKVFVNGTGWSQNYRDYLATLGLGSSQFGYAIPTGAGQLNALVYGNINQVSVQFSENVTVGQADLSLFGTGTSTFYNSTSFAFDSITHTATWTLASTIPADQLQLQLSSSTVTDAVTHALDGEWTNGTTTGPSGDGLPGGNFAFAFIVSATVPNVVHGDLNFDGGGNENDLMPFLAALTNLAGYQTSRGLSTADLNYIADFNGDHVVTNRDIQGMLDYLINLAGPGSGSGSAASEDTVADSSMPQIVQPTTSNIAPATSSLVVTASASFSGVTKPLVISSESPFVFSSSSSAIGSPSKILRTQSSVLSSIVPTAPTRRAAVVDSTIAEWSMYRSRHLHWQGDKVVSDEHDELIAHWA